MVTGMLLTVNFVLALLLMYVFNDFQLSVCSLSGAVDDEMPSVYI